MTQENWDNQLREITSLTHYIYLSPLPLVGLLFFLYPPSAGAWRESFGTFFSAIALFSGLTIAIAHWMYGQTLSKDSLEMRYKGVGFASALSSFKVGIILCASLGDLAAMLSIGFYLITREPMHLGVLLSFWGIHYVLGRKWLKIGQTTIQSILAKENSAHPQVHVA